MGAAARLNPRSFDGASSERAVLKARALPRVAAFIAAFPTREAYETYLSTCDLTDEQRGHLETLLPPHLRQGGTV